MTDGRDDGAADGFPPGLALLAGSLAILRDAQEEGRSEAALVAQLVQDAGAATAHLDSAGNRVDSDEDDDLETPARAAAIAEHRRATLRRARAGETPPVDPREVTYEDEPIGGAAVPIAYIIPRGGTWNPPLPRTAEQRQAEEEASAAAWSASRARRDAAHEREHGCIPCFEPFVRRAMPYGDLLEPEDDDER